MIPKIIHYCWFGRKPLSDMAKRCIESWKRVLPDYEIKEWNEDNFDINAWIYTKEAYEAKKYAFVSDVARLYALVYEGGIYMDTDVEVLRPLDCFLKEKAFSGFESDKFMQTAVMGSIPGFGLFKELLQEYDNLKFKYDNGKYNIKPNTERITETCLKKGLILNNTNQVISDFRIFPKDYFCPKDCISKEINITNNTYTVHHFDGSWLSEKEKQEMMRQYLENKFFNYMCKNIHNAMILKICKKPFKKAAKYYSVCKLEGIKGFILRKLH